MNNPFTHHPHSVDETYLMHFKHASGYGIKMIYGGMACILHAIFPFLCQNTASDVMLKMMRHYVSRMKNPEQRIIDIAALIAEKKQI